MCCRRTMCRQALLSAVFALPERIEGFDLPEALRLVTCNPAKAAGLHDRGEIAIGKRADLVQVPIQNIILWCAGCGARASV